MSAHPESEPPRVLADLARALRHLHKALLEVEASNFGVASGSFELLNLAANHPQFAWLRRLSELMADIDERRDHPELVTADDVAAAKKTLEALIGPSDPVSPGFRERYNAALQESPAAMMAHAEVRQVLQSLS